ncbi:MAG TPA: shikimate dehydrogenase [Acidimicrobiaceae bacterium]|nr:shikimate dehydrogenase [Acidimicrobiaceae bacterium]
MTARADGRLAGLPTAASAGGTTVAGVIGRPIGHSLSPTLFNAAFAHLGLDWTFAAWDVAPGDGEAAVRAMTTLDIAGLSVTMPHKHDALRGCDELDARAAALGAVNCVAARAGVLRGFNTDGDGLVAALRAELGLTLRGLPTAVVGAGGAGRSAALALAEAGARVLVANRSAAAAQSAAQVVGEWLSTAAGAGPGSCAVADSAAEAVASSTLVVQATPLGMADDDPLPFDPALLTDSHVVVDLIYSPAETRLLAAAKSRGAATANGVGMLLYQAAEQFRIWTGETAPVDVMRSAVGL